MSKTPRRSGVGRELEHRYLAKLFNERISSRSLSAPATYHNARHKPSPTTGVALFFPRRPLIALHINVSHEDVVRPTLLPAKPSPYRLPPPVDAVYDTLNDSHATAAGLKDVLCAAEAVCLLSPVGMGPGARAVNIRAVVEVVE